MRLQCESDHLYSVSRLKVLTLLLHTSHNSYVSYLHCFHLVSFIASVVLCAVFGFEKQLKAVK
jgi:hypothetical protein